MDIKAPDIHAFFAAAGAFAAAADKVDDEMALRLGSRFNVFDVIRPNENRISDILRDLLDPHGMHGQGDRFLRAFLTLCTIEAAWCSPRASVRVEREHRTTTLDSARRIDLVLHFAGTEARGAIAIENKPHAGEQVRQLEDYAEHLSREYDDRFWVIYLSGDGRGPTTLGEWDMRLRRDGRSCTIAYGNRGARQGRSTLQEWVKACAHLADADKIRWFLLDFEQWIGRTFDAPVSTSEARA